MSDVNAEFWNDMSEVEEVDLDDEKVNRILRWRELKNHLNGVKTILDVGAATGAFTIPLAKLGYEVTHLDVSSKMIIKAKEKAEDIRNLTFVQGDAKDLSRFYDNEFDLVIAFDGAISFSGKNAEKVIAECCRVGKKIAFSVSNKAVMTATWINYSLKNTGKLHPSIKEMLRNGYWNKEKYKDGKDLTDIEELKAYSTEEIEKILIKNNMIIREVRSLGSLTHLYLLHLYRQYSNEEVKERIKDISDKSEFVDLCDEFDKTVLKDGIGSFRRAGIIAIAEKKSINIEEITQRDAPMDLLLLADPEVEAINKYINKCKILIAKNFNMTVGVIAYKELSKNNYEIMNLAVSNEYEGNGIAKDLINEVEKRLKGSEKTNIFIGTGSLSLGPLMLYQKCGYDICDIKRNFFIDNYENEIWENGMKLKHMLVLKKTINE